MIPDPRPRVFVALPVYGGYHAHFVPCLAKLIQSPPANADLKIHANPGDSLVSRSRNRLTADFLRSDATHLLFLDTDLIFGPEQIERLISHDLDLVVGLYPKKQAQLAWVCNTVPEFGEADPATGIQRILYGGTGCMLIKRAVFEKIAAAFPEIQYDGDDGEPEGTYHDFFRVGVCLTRGRRRYLSEDWYFCEMARQVGVPCHADTRVVLKHCGEAIYPLVNPFTEVPSEKVQVPTEEAEEAEVAVFRSVTVRNKGVVGKAFYDDGEKKEVYAPAGAEFRSARKSAKGKPRVRKASKRPAK